ncbi:MAG: hypothetical protein OXK19_00560 [Candidatus Dadabacteria bacterium]|nr:hypothetical protein [Candidatus Dadabacteria bacterium]
MKRKTVFSAFVFLFVFCCGYVSASDYRESALSWQKQAGDTKVAVVSVAEELSAIGDKGNPTAEGLINDAVMWLGEGDKSFSKGDEEMEKEDFEKASFNYNMAWQYYVKAATAGLNARRMLTGK